MPEVHGDGMRLIMEARCREIGNLLNKVFEKHGDGSVGFCFMVFSFEGPEFTYISNAERESMIKMLEEVAAKMRKGEASQPWSGRS